MQYNPDGKVYQEHENDWLIRNSITWNGRNAYGFIYFSDTSYYSYALYDSANTLMSINHPFGTYTGANTLSLSLKYPMMIGEEVTLRDTNSDLEILVLRDTAVKLTVEAGTFTCLQYDDIRFYPTRQDTISMNSNYYAFGFGPIRYDEYLYNDAGVHKYHWVTQQLKDYRIF